MKKLYIAFLLAGLLTPSALTAQEMQQRVEQAVMQQAGSLAEYQTPLPALSPEAQEIKVTIDACRAKIYEAFNEEHLFKINPKLGTNKALIGRVALAFHISRFASTYKKNAPLISQAERNSLLNYLNDPIKVADDWQIVPSVFLRQNLPYLESRLVSHNYVNKLANEIQQADHRTYISPATPLSLNGHVINRTIKTFKENMEQFLAKGKKIKSDQEKANFAVKQLTQSGFLQEYQKRASLLTPEEKEELLVFLGLPVPEQDGMFSLCECLSQQDLDARIKDAEVLKQIQDLLFQVKQALDNRFAPKPAQEQAE